MYNPKITAKKGTFTTILVFLLDYLIQWISSAPIDLLDISVRAGAIGLIVAIMNYVKHRKN